MQALAETGLLQLLQFMATRCTSAISIHIGLWVQNEPLALLPVCWSRKFEVLPRLDDQKLTEIKMSRMSPSRFQVGSRSQNPGEPW